MTAPISASPDVSPTTRFPCQVLPLRDGRCVTIRPVRPQDAPLEQAFVESLSPASRRNRFHGETNGLTDSMLRYLTCVDQRWHVGLVATADQGGKEVIIADARYVVEADGETAEFAVAVADAWQGLGLAQQLLDTLLQTAQFSGLRWLVGEVLASNGRMLAFVERCGFARTTRGVEPGVVHVERSVAQPFLVPPGSKRSMVHVVCAWLRDTLGIGGRPSESPHAMFESF